MITLNSRAGKALVAAGRAKRRRIGATESWRLSVVSITSRVFVVAAVPYRVAVAASSPLTFIRTPPYRAFSPKWLCPYLYVAHMYVRVSVCACVFIPTWVNGGASPPARHHRRTVPLLGAFFSTVLFRVFFLSASHASSCSSRDNGTHSHLRATATTTTVCTMSEFPTTTCFPDLFIFIFLLAIFYGQFFYPQFFIRGFISTADQITCLATKPRLDGWLARLYSVRLTLVVSSAF